jgi:hypothetical protein
MDRVRQRDLRRHGIDHRRRSFCAFDDPRVAQLARHAPHHIARRAGSSDAGDRERAQRRRPRCPSDQRHLGRTGDGISGSTGPARDAQGVAGSGAWQRARALPSAPEQSSADQRPHRRRRDDVARHCRDERNDRNDVAGVGRQRGRATEAVACGEIGVCGRSAKRRDTGNDHGLHHHGGYDAISHGPRRGTRSVVVVARRGSRPRPGDESQTSRVVWHPTSASARTSPRTSSVTSAGTTATGNTNTGASVGTTATGNTNTGASVGTTATGNITTGASVSTLAATTGDGPHHSRVR